MNVLVRTGVNRPTAQQEFLLQAALLKGPESLRSWETWISGNPIDFLDIGAQRLLPLLYRNLRAQGVSHPALTTCKGIYRRAWYQNQILFHEMIPLIRSFHEEGIHTLVLKGAALVAGYYKDPGLRPMDDFDLLVPVAGILPAIHHLKELKWHPRNALDAITEANLPYKRAIHLRSPSGSQLDLHCHILFETPEKDADGDFWKAAVPATLVDAPVRILNPSDQLLHACVHGLMWNPVPSLRWIADAHVILQTAPTLDWDRLLEQAERCEVVLSVGEALQYVSRLLHAPVPSDVLERLKHIPVSHWDRRQYEAFNRSLGLLGNLPKRWHVYAHRFAGDSRGVRRLWGFLRFLKFFWKLDSVLQVPPYAFGRGVRRLGNRLFGTPVD
jgi:hypothetical protein